MYSDEGAGPRSVRLLVKTLRNTKFNKKCAVACIDRNYFQENNWEKQTALLIFPGGRDIFYHSTLKGNANTLIKAYVAAGGSYMGLCAGGYYGCSEIEFEKGHPLEVVDTRELGFFPGLARGSAYGPNRFRYEDESGSCGAQLELLGEGWSSKLASVYFNGGCTFVDANEQKGTTVLARYCDLPEQPAAIIHCSVGKGRAVLSGVHPEYGFTHLKKCAGIPEEVLARVSETEKLRAELFEVMLACCLG